MGAKSQECLGGSRWREGNFREKTCWRQLNHRVLSARFGEKAVIGRRIIVWWEVNHVRIQFVGAAWEARYIDMSRRLRSCLPYESPRDQTL